MNLFDLWPFAAALAIVGVFMTVPNTPTSKEMAHELEMAKLEAHGCTNCWESIKDSQ